MAITFVGFGATTAAGGNSNIQNSGGVVTPQLPANEQVGDLIVLFCMSRGTGSTGFTSPGYTQAANFLGTGSRVAILVKRAASEAEANPAVTTTGTPGTNNPTIVLTAIFRGVDMSLQTTFRELGANTRNLATTTNTTGFNFPGAADPLLDGSLFLVASAGNNDYTTAPAAGATGFSILAFETTTGSDCSLVAAYQIQSANAAIAQGTFGGDTTGVAAANTNASIIETVKAAVPESFGFIL